MTWRRIALSRLEFESGELAVFQGAFQEAYVAGNAPRGMALFGNWSTDGTCYFLYTSPNAAPYILPLLEAYSAEPLDPPDESSLTFIFGDEAGGLSPARGLEA